MAGSSLWHVAPVAMLLIGSLTVPPAGAAPGKMTAKTIAKTTAPPGYYIDASEATQNPPETGSESSGEYRWSVERIAPDERALRLLAIAEATYPNRALVIRIAEEEGSEVGSDTANVPLWWHQGTGPRRIPYALTRGALNHYIALTRKYRDNERREPGAQPLFSSELTYRATIALKDEYSMGDRNWDGVYVASIGLTWTFDDGTFLPVVHARRTVVLSKEGDVIAVDGDGGAIEDVSMSSHRAVGRSKRLFR